LADGPGISLATLRDALPLASPTTISKTLKTKLPTQYNWIDFILTEQLIRIYASYLPLNNSVYRMWLVVNTK
jgi:hypothetical protein